MTQKWWMIVAGLGMFMITIFGFLFASNDRQPDTLEASLDELPWEEESEEAVPQEEEVELSTVIVDVKGEVERPGVYEFDQGYRVDDAIRMAGGVSETGNEAYVNFAQVLTDEMVIYVPHEDEEEGSLSERWAGTTEAEGAGATVDINTATEQDLQTLPGIGPAKAQAIVTYREENGRFDDPSELMNVSGIGEKSFAALVDQIATP